MFQYGEFNTSDVDGLEAVLQSWPGLPGLAIETVEVPGQDGAFYAAGRLGQGGFGFDLTITSDTPAGALSLASGVAEACAPSHGLQPLALDLAPGWVWYAAAAAELKWARGLWVPGAQCTLKAPLTFQCPDPYGYAVPDETASGTTTATIDRTRGNVTSWPRIEVQGTFTAVHLDVGGDGLDVEVAVAAGERLVLDYADMDFAVWDAAGTSKLRHATKGMSHYDRLALPLGETVVTATPTGGTVTALAIKANSRRA